MTIVIILIDSIFVFKMSLCMVH